MICKGIFVLVLFFLSTACSVIGGGSGSRYDELSTGSCNIRVQNEGSFLSGHHIVGRTVARKEDSQRLDRMRGYLIEEGYNVRQTSNNQRLVGVFISNGKQYQINVQVEEHDEGEVKLDFAFSSPPFIGLRTEDVQQEFCRLEAIGQRPG